MTTTLFVQASLKVNNRFELPSLVLERVGPEPLFALMLKRLAACKKVDEIYVVTSSEKCDDAIITVVNALAENDSRIKSLRIHPSSPYAFLEGNCVLGDGNFLYKTPLYGFNSAECLLEYAQMLNFDRAVIMTADNTILMEPFFLDTLIENYGNEEGLIGQVAIIPVPEIESAFRQFKLRSEKEYKADLKKTGEIINDLNKKRVYSPEKLQEIQKLKQEALLKKRKRLVSLPELIGYSRDRNRREERGAIPELAGNQHNMFPVYTEYHLSRIRELSDTLKTVTLTNFFEKTAALPQQISQEMPGYIEVELTGNCNLACDTCPQTKLTRQKSDMEVATFKQIVDAAKDYVPFLCLAGYGEPTLHPKLIDCIRYAKEKKFLRVCLETNGTKLDEILIRALIEVKLDILVINVDAYDRYSGKEKNSALHPSEEIIDTIIRLKNEHRYAIPYLVLQVVKTSANDDEIEYYFDRWQHIVDHIVIQPYNDFLGVFPKDDSVNFAPLKEANSQCKKTLCSAFLCSDGKPLFCNQRFDKPAQSSDWLEPWRNNRLQGLRQDFCTACTQWYLLDFPSMSFYPNVSIQKAEQYLYETLIPQGIKEGEFLYNNKEYEKALDVWESVLKFDPANQFIHQKLDELLQQSS